jgi:hypothetical protein
MTELKNARLSGDEVIETPYGPIELQHTFVTDESSKVLFDVMDLQRASQAYIWCHPQVSFYSWMLEQNRVYKSGDLGVFVVFDSLKEKRGIVTANLTTPYVIQWCDLAKGPLVFDYPAGPTAGGVLDLWQRPVIDLGLTGPDQGKGGKYIIVGPEHDLARYEQEDAYVYQAETNTIFIALRLLDPSPEFAEKVKQTFKIAIYGQNIRPSTFVEGLDIEWSATAPRGLAYWETLHQAINSNPVREQDKVWMAMIEPLGIKKGEPFNPDDRQKKILLEGVALGELMIRNIQINPRYTEPYWSGTYWYKSFDFTTRQITDYKVELDERSTWFYEAVTSSEGMVNPAVGKGQVYMTTKRDSSGALVRADRTYRLVVPANVPVTQFWSLTLYSENTRRSYDNGGTEIASSSLDSRMEQLQYNPSGSIDLYIGHQAPEGKESNYMKTVDEDGWFVIFRLYGPTEPFFDKSFTLPDFEKLT